MMAMSKLKTAAVVAIVCLTGGAGAWISAAVIRGGPPAADAGRGSLATGEPSIGAATTAAPAASPFTSQAHVTPPQFLADAAARRPVAVAPPGDAVAPPAGGEVRAANADRALEAQLARTLPEVNFDGTGLSDAIDFLRDVTGANIMVDWKALEAANVNRDTKVTVRLKNVKFSQALKLMLDSAAGNTKLRYTVENNVITITTAEGGARGGAGEGVGAAGDGERPAGPAADKPDPKLKALLDRALPELDFNGVGLSDVIDFLRDVSGANIVVNWKALEQAGIERNTPVTLRLKNVKFGQALSSVLTSAGGNAKLRYTLEANVITIAPAGARAAPAPAGAADKGAVETVYNVQKLIGRLVPAGAGRAGADAAAKSVGARRNVLVNLITGSIAPTTWKANGGTGEITQSGNELVIVTSADNHKAIANLFQRLEELLPSPGAGD